MTAERVPAPRPCRACGVELRFARTADGKIMPLEAAKVVVYSVAETPDLVGHVEPTLADRLEGFVAHWNRCPKADAFRNRKAARASADE